MIAPLAMGSGHEEKRMAGSPEHIHSWAKDAPAEWFPWVLDDPHAVRIAEDKDALTWRRDRSGDPPREAGVVNPQRYAGGVMPLGGFPTFLGAPMAFSTKDLRASGVDVALVGLTIDDNPVPGARFAANTMRALRDWMSFPTGGTDNTTGVDWGSLSIADYGNVGSLANQPERSLEEVHKVISEILEADAIPLGVGGAHVQTYGMITALAAKHGPGEFVVLQVDGHADAYLNDLGRTVHNGSMCKIAIDRGLIKGSDLVQIGLRGQGHDRRSLEWMREAGIRYHFQAEINERGWDSVLSRILDEVKGRKVYLTFDIDGIDPGFAPGVGTQDADGLTPRQAMALVRAIGIQNDVIAADFLEYNPLTDDAHQSTGVLMDRLIRTLLGGIAARREGISDPFYVDPLRLDHGQAG